MAPDHDAHRPSVMRRASYIDVNVDIDIDTTVDVVGLCCAATRP